MTFDPTDQYGENKILLTIEDEILGYDVTAYCSPDSIGMTYAGDEPVQNDDGELFGAPFQVDIALPERTDIGWSEDRDLRQELGERFDDEFTQKTRDVYNKVMESDDPLDTIMEMDAPDLTKMTNE